MNNQHVHFLTRRLLSLLAPLAFAIPLTASGLFPLLDGEVKVHGDLSVTHDTNIFANENERSDWFLSLRPSLQYLRAAGLLNLDMSGGVEVLRFDKFDDQDTEDLFANLLFSYPNRPGANRAQAEGGIGWQEQSSADETLGERVTSEEWKVHGDLRVDHSERFATRGGVEYSERRFDERRFSRSDQGSLYGDALWVYSEKLDFFAGYRIRDWRSRGAAGRESFHTYDHRLLLGAEGQLSPKVTGSLGAGVQYRNFRKPDELSDTLRPSFAAALEWAARDTTTVRLDAEQDFRTTPDDRSIEQYTGALTLRQQVHQRAHLRTGLSYGHLRFDDTLDGRRIDDRYGALIGLVSEFNHGFTGSVDYNYLLSDSNRGRSDYERHIVEAKVSASF